MYYIYICTVYWCIINIYIYVCVLCVYIYIISKKLFIICLLYNIKKCIIYIYNKICTCLESLEQYFKFIFTYIPCCTYLIALVRAHRCAYVCVPVCENLPIKTPSNEAPRSWWRLAIAPDISEGIGKHCCDLCVVSNAIGSKKLSGLGREKARTPKDLLSKTVFLWYLIVLKTKRRLVKQKVHQGKGFLPHRFQLMTWRWQLPQHAPGSPLRPRQPLRQGRILRFDSR